MGAKMNTDSFRSGRYFLGRGLDFCFFKPAISMLVKAGFTNRLGRLKSWASS